MHTSSSPQKTPFRKLAYGGNRYQYGELYVPAGSGPHPVVILIHGGFWRKAYDLTLMQGLAQQLITQQIAVWNIEYRRVGNTGGAWPETLLDVARAADYLRSMAPHYQLDLQRVITVGHSAGGHLAFWLAARQRLPQKSQLRILNDPLPLVGAISQAGVVDLEHADKLHLGNDAAQELLGGSFADQLERYKLASPAALLPLDIPQVLVHGTADDRVPLVISQAYQQKAQAAGDDVTLIELPGADHFILIDPASEAWQQTLVEIKRLLMLV
ncbi:hypothetical protein KDA_62830 [Dictyobacter alpinus]|uniref:BD-FAE-like domain-containing protein n=1 Tax=Dictyobacter alpinus TaxID=2014873 RepID=A0A402BHJ9_9CHLR|nr:alpha/beta hydrolase [Dictyobacter alpinus]GCE30799.1 hypothetical protein KDA_62830 [Dictyobacter alpinus]